MRKEVAVGVSEEFGATPIAHLVQLATGFDSRIYVEVGTSKINAKSIMGMMSLVLREGQTVTVVAEGPDEQEACDAIGEFLEKNI
ncbi:MAG: HPr family phosphocarrier protein [Lachnospiraceae bacterium]|nr:HPr family phosphocarrier protein [Lachnospiraceae bacterium]